MARLPPPITMTTSSIPEASASSTPYWIVGLSRSGSISFGWALVTGRNRVPRPAAVMIALRTGLAVIEENLAVAAFDVLETGQGGGFSALTWSVRRLVEEAARRFWARWSARFLRPG